MAILVRGLQGWNQAGYRQRHAESGSPESEKTEKAGSVHDQNDIEDAELVGPVHPPNE